MIAVGTIVCVTISESQLILRIGMAFSITARIPMNLSARISVIAQNVV